MAARTSCRANSARGCRLNSVQVGSGYQIAWKHGAADEYLVWTTDGTGNWLSQGSVMSGTSFALESLEPTFGYDLNGDGTVGVVTTTIEAFGATDLKQVANNFYLYAHGTTTGPELKFSGAAVTTGQFAAYTPIASEASGGGYKVAWKNGAANEYLVWTTDAGGNWLSQTAAMSGTTYAMQSLETTYNQDLNGDGTVGLKVTTIEAIGTVDLKQVADTFFFYDHGTTTGPQLKMSGAAVTVGQFDTWTPLGVEKTGNGYLAIWKHGAADKYTVWTIDGGGNWLSQSAVAPGSSAEIQSLEPGFNQDLNGVGGITARFVINSFVDHPGQHRDLYHAARDRRLAGPPAQAVRRARHVGPVRRVYADCCRGEWRRLQGRLEERPHR